MNTHRNVLAFSLTVLLACASVDAAESNGFLRSIGSITQSDAGVRTIITATSSTNAQPDISISWQAGDATSSESKSMIHAGWFAFLERPNRIWIFDGDTLNLVERHGVTVADTAGIYKDCPAQVRDALPEKIREKYFK